MTEPVRTGLHPADPLPPALREALEQVTPARLFHGGSPLAYPTKDWLALRADHAAARDALFSRIDLADPILANFVRRHQPIEVASAAGSTSEYLARPDLGRRLSSESRRRLAGLATPPRPNPAIPGHKRPRVAVALGDGLSAMAAIIHGPAMVEGLVQGAGVRGWTAPTPLVVQRCRVGILNELGPLLGADVIVLLVGERPGLGVADSLSAYLAYRPRPGHSNAERNLVSGIHARGTTVAEAVPRVLDLVGLLLAAGLSGVTIKEGGLVSPSLELRPGSGAELSRPPRDPAHPDG